MCRELAYHLRSFTVKNLRSFLIQWTFCVLLLAVAGSALGETWAEKLGYPSGKRVLILHADDIGMCYEANAAAMAQLTNGDIQAAAMMVPCPWFTEIAAWYKEHPDYDMGLHLALTAEWRNYRWGPVAPHNEVPGLLDKKDPRFMWRGVLGVVTSATAEEVEREVRAQVEQALALGIRPSHLDTHMGTLYARPDFTAAYLKVAEEYRIPAMALAMSPEAADKFRKKGYPITDEMIKVLEAYSLPKLDNFDAVPNGKTYEEKLENFFKLVRSFEPGITEIIFHPSIDTEGLHHITNSWQQRVWESQMFADPQVKQFFEREGILFTNWKEMMKRFDERFGEGAEK